MISGATYQRKCDLKKSVKRTGFYVSDPDDCLFDQQLMCFWTVSGNNDYKWVRNQGKTSSKGTGPENDHTTSKSTQKGLVILCILLLLLLPSF